jgi:hypothetical protein
MFLFFVLCLWSGQSEFMAHFMVNGYPKNAPSPLKSPSYERTKKFKCLYTHAKAYNYSPARFLRIIRVYGQIHAPATLPNYVNMFVMNSIL